MESQQILPLLAGLGAGYALCKAMNPAPKAVAKPKHIKLTYFAIPGRAEVSRLCFAYAGIEIEDNRIDYPTWGAMKATCKPWGQLPELDVDGVKVYQSMAIARYAGRVAGLLPEDPLEEAKMNEIIDSMEDLFSAVKPTFGIKDEAEKTAARIALASPPSGGLHLVLGKFEQLFGDCDTYVVGNSMTVADIALFCFCSMFTSGWKMLDGIPDDCLSYFPKLLKHHAMVGRLMAIQNFYKKQLDDPIRSKGYLVE